MSAWHPRWPDLSARGSLILPLPDDAFAELASTLQVDGIVLARKPEFHVTLLDRAQAAAVATIAAQLRALFESLDWGWRRRGERWLLREFGAEGAAHTVIELLDMPAFDSFRAHAGAAPAPAHVTLYTAGATIGIGLSSQAEFESLRLRPL